MGQFKRETMMMLKHTKTASKTARILGFCLVMMISLSCAAPQKEFESKDALASTVVDLINRADGKKLVSLLIERDEYLEAIHPFTRASHPEYGMNGEDYWRIFIAQRRLAAIDSKIEKYRGAIQRIAALGDVRDVLDCGDFRLHRKTALTLVIEDGHGGRREIVDDEILGVVIERQGRFRLLNMFR
jgi:hypothetical protein